MTKKFHKIIFVHVPRSQNILANSLASLSSAFSFPLHQDEKTIILQRLYIPATQDPWFAKVTKELKNRVKTWIGLWLKLSHYLKVTKNSKKNFPNFITLRHIYKTGRILNQLLLTNGIRYVAWLTSTSLSRVRSSGEDSTVSFSDVSQTKKLIKL